MHLPCKPLLSTIAIASAIIFAQTEAPIDSTAIADTASTSAPSISTEIKGEVHGFLKQDDSPYLVTGDLVVAPNTSLLIEPGVDLYFKPGTGLQVDNGQLVIAGSRMSPVRFLPASEDSKAGDWKGISITGEERAEIRNTHISGAAANIAVENGSADLQKVSIENGIHGIYARNASVTANDCYFGGNQVGFLVSNYANVKIDRNAFEKNKVAIVNSELAETKILSSRISNNETGVLNMGNTLVTLSKTKIAKNDVGVASAEILAPEIIESAKGNKKNISSEAEATMTVLPPAPEIPGIQARPFKASDRIVSVSEKRLDEPSKNDSSKTRWKIIGNAMVGLSYHIVNTTKNENDSLDIVDNDTILTGEKYKNTFQVPGLAGAASVFLMMQSTDGKTIEFNTDLSIDAWNHFAPNPVTLSYMDGFNKATLGDFMQAGGETYMAGIPIFGADYTVSLLRNNANQPLFELNGFFGEAKRSLVEGARHPYIYNDYIEDGELQAQRIAYGGFIKWAPLRRFNIKAGVIYANDELEDPILRDGASSTWTTNDPMQESVTFYADGNWLFFPGNIELNGQIAVGRADTTDAIRQRAINQVFYEAGLNPSSFNLLRQLMQNQSRINSLSDAELYSIFGENTTLSRSEMRESLRTLISEAKSVQKQEQDDRDEGRVMGLNWGSQNFAIGASLNWSTNKTSINTHIKYVGEDFYSAGSPDQLSDTREFGVRVDQHDILGFWNLGLGYQVNVEKAAHEDKTNIFGLSEGSEWGLFGGASDSWLEEHELDNDRTKYIQKARIDNIFKINKNLSASFSYNFEYMTQHRPFQLHGSNNLEDGIYKDGWFSARKGRDSTLLVNKGDSAYVDTERWEEYMDLIEAPYLASCFQEKIFKNIWNVGATFRATKKSVIKANGVFAMRTDASVFHKDELIKNMDLANSTWGKLGYYFSGANYFEQAYPISVTTIFPILQNRFAFTPRYKSYNRDDMSEIEYTVEEEIEVPFMNRFLVLDISSSFRYMNTDWNEEGKDFKETEMDILGNANLRVNHNKKFYTEWFAGTAIYLRPDNKSYQYSDIYMGVNAHYVF